MENVVEMYSFVERSRQCYQLLQDDLSRNIFQTRLMLDFDQSPENIAQIVSLGEPQKWMDIMEKNIPAILHAVEQKPRKLILYGTNVTGRSIAKLFKKNNVDFYGFSGRRFKDFSDGLMGKPVISPDYLFQNPDEFYVILAMRECLDDGANVFRKNHFPQDQILARFRPFGEMDHQYFDFPDLFHHGTAFVDAGCLDCHTSYLFAEWCNGEYSKIYAFEPDPISYSVCERNLADKKIERIRLVQAGLSDHYGKMPFAMGLYTGSHIVDDTIAKEENTVMVPITTIDGTVGEDKIGFIKMDIEGAELDALHGAKNVIVRDKPLMAISVYHRTGDMLAIMDYLRCLAPQYRFWLRHYSIGVADTVLYASVDRVQ